MITPTANRPSLLPFAYQFLRAMKESDWEWIVLDDGETPCPFLAELTDERVRYLRMARGLTLGGKRNEAVGAARGRFILHIDDDDYYAPSYPAKLLAKLDEGAGLAKLGAWLVYSVGQGVLGWVDTAKRRGPHWELSGRGLRPVRIRGEREKLSGEADEVVVETPEVGWGFSFAYRRETWQACPFPDVGWNEDGRFATEVVRRWGLGVVAGKPRLCLHLVHANAVSASFPCRLLRAGLIRRLFPPSVCDLIRAAASLPA
jgi:glycosyltransferase involved in cell wall biosynthesis